MDVSQKTIKTRKGIYIERQPPGNETAVVFPFYIVIVTFYALQSKRKATFYLSAWRKLRLVSSVSTLRSERFRLAVPTE